MVDCGVLEPPWSQASDIMAHPARRALMNPRYPSRLPRARRPDHRSRQCHEVTRHPMLVNFRALVLVGAAHSGTPGCRGAEHARGVCIDLPACQPEGSVLYRTVRGERARGACAQGRRPVRVR
jgi:hypothetical protein